MTIARRRPATIAAIAPMPSPAALPMRPLGVPLPLGDAPAPDAVTPVGRLRRCVFRRIDRVATLPQRSTPATYEIMCLYGDGPSALPLGDIEAARPICAACTATGIFRPDEA